jgi:carbonic anhydrase/acetyltransferase-like protein (isoleucine patch superfamily)
VLVERNDVSPIVARDARIAESAQVIGNVLIGEGCVVGHGAVIESSGPEVRLDAGVVVMSGAVVRSVGGVHRPAFPVRVGAETLVGPLAALAGCLIEDACYVATGVMVFQDVVVGEGTRLGAGSIVHVGTRLPPASRVGLRHYAVPGEDGEAVITADVEEARRHLAGADFFGHVFDADGQADLAALHRRTTAILRAEAAGWTDRVL